MAQIFINCLVRVTTENPQDFVEWLEYHIAMGFDRIFVFDTGCRSWLDGIVDRYREHVTFVPRNDDWKFKRRMIQAYVDRRTVPCWAVCLDDDEYLWLDYSKFRSLHHYMELVKSEAVSIYVKYLSSAKPINSRVGTLIDCFQHCRKNPQGKVNPHPKTPNMSVTMFFVRDNKTVPLINPVIPATSNWTNTRGELLNSNTFLAYLESDRFEPTAYPLRVYKYALKSLSEMGGDESMKPEGYEVEDNSMQQARELLLRIPVNPTAEEMFAKDSMEVEQVDPTARQLTPEEIAEAELPVPLARIDSAILNGRTYDEVVGYICNNSYQPTDEHKATIRRLYDRERRMIIESSPAYRKLYDMMKNPNNTNTNFMTELGVGGYALDNMKRCLKVLDIEGYDREHGMTLQELIIDEPTPEDIQEQKAAEKVVANEDIVALTSSYDESVSATKQTTEEQQKIEDKDDAKRKRARETRKKYRDKKKAEKEAAKKELEAPPVVKAEDMAELRNLVKECTASSPEQGSERVELDKALDTDLDEEDANLLNSIDLSAFTDK